MWGADGKFDVHAGERRLTARLNQPRRSLREAPRPPPLHPSKAALLGVYYDPRFYSDPASFAGYRYVADAGASTGRLRIVGTDDGLYW